MNLYKTVILAVVLYGGEISSLILSPEGKRQLGRRGISGRITLGWTLWREGELDSASSGLGPVAGFL
jgi:hypothetical protein